VFSWTTCDAPLTRGLHIAPGHRVWGVGLVAEQGDGEALVRQGSDGDRSNEGLELPRIGGHLWLLQRGQLKLQWAGSAAASWPVCSKVMGGPASMRNLAGNGMYAGSKPRVSPQGIESTRGQTSVRSSLSSRSPRASQRRSSMMIIVLWPPAHTIGTMGTNSRRASRMYPVRPPNTMR
jgi:hypothetical protein